MKKTITKLIILLFVGLFILGAMSCTSYTCPTYSQIETPTNQNL